MPEPDYGTDLENYASTLTKNVEERDKLNLLLGDIKTEESNQSRHILNHERWFKKRFGIRPAVMNWPWRNASNLHLPLTDKTMRRSKPTFVNLVNGIYPTVTFESNVIGEEQWIVRAVERKFHHILHDEDKMAIDLPIAWGVDMMLEKGRFIVKVIQEFTPLSHREEITLSKLPEEVRAFLFSPETTDQLLALEISMRYSMSLDNADDVRQIQSAIRQIRSGKDTIRFEREINMTPFPSLFVRDPTSVIFPNDTTFFISQARWIRDRIALSTNDMERRADSGAWDRGNAKELLRRLAEGGSQGRYAYSNPQRNSTTNNLRQLEESREGVSPNLELVPVVDEVYHWRKFGDRRLAEPAVLTIHPDHPDLPLRLIRYPYLDTNGRPEDWPFEQVHFELVSDRALAPRGYPQILDSIQTELTNNHNAKQNWMTISNSLNLKVKRNSNVSTNWIPGQPLWVNRMDDVQEINIAPRDMSFDNEERILKSWAEEYIGILDQTLTNQTGTPERRTKAEIEAISALQAQVASLDARIFQMCMQRVYKKVWNRWMQYGPETIELQTPNGELFPVPKRDLSQRYRLFPTGNINNTNRQAQSIEVRSIMETVGASPFVDQFELVQYYLNLKDERLAQLVLVRPETAKSRQVERFISDILNIKEGYTIIPRPDDDNETAIMVIDDYLKDPVKRRNFPMDRLEFLANFRQAHELALQKKSQATTRGGRMEQEVAKVAQGAEGREARE